MRKTKPEPTLTLADFDERLWPVNVLLFLFAACVAGIIVAKSDFGSPRLPANGWCHLGALAVIVAALAWGIVRLEGRVRHRMQLGVFLSLLVHLWLCMLSYNLHLSAIARRENDSAEVVEQPKPVTLPDYNWQDEAMDDATDPTLDRLVETPTPDTEAEIERTEPAEEPKERPAEREPEVRPQPSPTPVERAESSAPRRAELAGPTVSRQERRFAETNEQATLPQIDIPRSVERQSLDSAVRVERATTDTLSDSQRPESETRLPTSGPSAAALVRRPADDRTPAGSIAITRQPTEAESSDPIRADSERVAERANSAARLAPQLAEVQRADTAVKVARRNRPANEPRSLMVEPSPRRAQRASQPRVDSRTDARLAKSITTPTTSPASVDTPRATTRSQPNQLPETRVESIARATPSPVEASSMVADAAQELVERSRTNLKAAPIEAAARAGSEPSVSSAAPKPASRRATMAGATDAAPADASPAAAALSASQPITKSSTPALYKSSGGASGLTRQQNFDSDLPGASPNAITRSAARRPEATQAINNDRAIAPSDAPRIARSRAGAEVPSAILAAENAPVADAAGSRRPAENDASASAAVERAAASAPRGRITAAAGSGMIDQGRPRIRSAIGEGRTSGGGQPSLSRGELQVRIAKATGAGEIRGTDGAVAVQAPASAASEKPSGVVPNLAAMGRETPALPQGSAAAPRMADGSPAPVGLSESTPRRAESSPDLAGQLAAAGEPRTTAGRAGLDAVDGRAEAIDPLPATIGGAGPQGDSGLDDAGPPSASDLVRQTSPGHLARGSEMGESGASSAAPIGAGLPRRAGEELAASFDNTGGTSPGKSLVPATIGEASAVVDAIGVGSSPARGGIDASRPSDLSAVRQAAALPVLAAAPVGAGGLGGEPAVDVGVPSRLARPESDVAHLDSGRLILERAGANRAAEVRVQDVAVPGFRQRDRQLREELARQRGGSASSEQAVEMGLDFLARHQNVDGSWSLQVRRFAQGRPGYENAGDGQMVSDTAATGLAMLAFLGAGYTHTDGKYRLVVGRGLNYLLGNQRPDGDLFLPQEAKSNLNVWLYSHGIASIALCEAYGMTRDPNLRQPAQRALDFIVASQHPTEGGWRYSPRQGSDTSVSGWQLMALKSGELAGLQVPAPTYAKVARWLDGAATKTNPAHYVYRPKAAREHQRTASRVMTAEALLMRQYLGWKRNNPLMSAGADYLLDNLPDWSNEASRQRDSYYWYYATQVMFQMGGQHWDAWNEQLRPLLVEKQTAEGPLAGSWEPLGDVPDRWGREGGRIYITAMHLLMLEVYYRHLPLYRTLEGE